MSKTVKLTESQLRRIIQEAAGGDVGKKLEDAGEHNKKFKEYLEKQISHVNDVMMQTAAHEKQLRNAGGSDDNINILKEKYQQLYKLVQVLEKVKRMGDFIFVDQWGSELLSATQARKMAQSDAKKEIGMTAPER